MCPYYSWQRSHQVHHTFCNNLELGESNIPSVVSDDDINFQLKKALGENLYGAYCIFCYYCLGWPVYLVTGVTGGQAYGKTNHFWPWNQGKKEMWPGKWKKKVFLSDIGIVVMLVILTYWARATSITYVFLRYVLPWIVINFFLVFYNLLTHTDVDIPYFDEDNWEHVKGSF